MTSGDHKVSKCFIQGVPARNDILVGWSHKRLNFASHLKLWYSTLCYLRPFLHLRRESRSICQRTYLVDLMVWASTRFNDNDEFHGFVCNFEDAQYLFVIYGRTIRKEKFIRFVFVVNMFSRRLINEFFLNLKTRGISMAFFTSTVRLTLSYV